MAVSSARGLLWSAWSPAGQTMPEPAQAKPLSRFRNGVSVRSVNVQRLRLAERWNGPGPRLFGTRFTDFGPSRSRLNELSTTSGVTRVPSEHVTFRLSVNVTDRGRLEGLSVHEVATYGTSF